mgnify:CR=1 FL=1
MSLCPLQALVKHRVVRGVPCVGRVRGILGGPGVAGNPDRIGDFAADQFEWLHEHLFQPGGDEQAAYAFAAPADGPDRLKLLVVKEGERADFRYLPVQRGTCVELVLPMRLLALAAQGQGFATMN